MPSRERAIHYKQRLELGKAEFMRNAGEPGLREDLAINASILCKKPTMKPCPCQTDFAWDLRLTFSHSCPQLIVNKQLAPAALATPAKIAAGMDFLMRTKMDAFSTKISTDNFPL
jgi:hypothetical protein